MLYIKSLLFQTTLLPLDSVSLQSKNVLFFHLYQIGYFLFTFHMLFFFPVSRLKMFFLWSFSFYSIKCEHQIMNFHKFYEIKLFFDYDFGTICEKIFLNNTHGKAIIWCSYSKLISIFSIRCVCRFVIVSSGYSIVSKYLIGKSQTVTA